MLFNSYEFIFFFLPFTFLVYFYLNAKRLTTASQAWLVFASLFFYSWWNIAYLPLILISILFNYSITSAMVQYDEKRKNYFSKKALLQIALVFNIGLLAYFKYMDFFISNTNLLLSTEIPLLHLALPLAISFFTLQQIAFVVDSYEGLVKEKNFLDYTLFVTFFPQLIAGPIVHHVEMMPQFASKWNRVKRYKNIATGLFIFSIGLFKKVVIADTFAKWATAGFDAAPVLNFFEAWATSLSYTFQLYFDFSGYTDMAIGAALLFNIRLPQNFNSPYRATGMIDFWKRWHMTLTNFITIYIYTPIIRSFSKLTFNKAMLATVITFLIAGLWHGASWMFVIFGGLHGVGIASNHYWKKLKIKMPVVLAWFITFNFVNLAFIFFRANDMDDAFKVIKGMLGGFGFTLSEKYLNIFPFLHSLGFDEGDVTVHIGDGSKSLKLIILSFVIVLLLKNTQYLAETLRFNKRTLLFVILLSGAAVLRLNDVSDFLYFNF